MTDVFLLDDWEKEGSTERHWKVKSAELVWQAGLKWLDMHVEKVQQTVDDEDVKHERDQGLKTDCPPAGDSWNYKSRLVCCGRGWKTDAVENFGGVLRWRKKGIGRSRVWWWQRFCTKKRSSNEEMVGGEEHLFNLKRPILWFCWLYLLWVHLFIQQMFKEPWLHFQGWTYAMRTRSQFS